MYLGEKSVPLVESNSHSPKEKKNPKNCIFLLVRPQYLEYFALNNILIMVFCTIKVKVLFLFLKVSFVAVFNIQEGKKTI